MKLRSSGPADGPSLTFDNGKRQRFLVNTTVDIVHYSTAPEHSSNKRNYMGEQVLKPGTGKTSPKPFTFSEFVYFDIYNEGWTYVRNVPISDTPIPWKKDKDSGYEFVPNHNATKSSKIE